MQLFFRYFQTEIGFVQLVQWDGSSWQEIGQVTGGNAEGSVAAENQKDSHDFVVDVQLEGSEIPLKLAFNLKGIFILVIFKNCSNRLDK